MMTRTLTFALVAAAALAGCNNDDHNIVVGPPGDDTNTAANAGVQLPPSIASTKTYRCADNAVVSIDWMSDSKSANVRVGKSGSPTQVVAAEAGKPMTGPAGYSVNGSPTASSVTIAVPGHKAQSCKA